MKHNYPNRMIKPRQISNRATPKVTNLAQAKSQALAQAKSRSGIPLNELVATESFSDKTVRITVNHNKSTQIFHFEFECTNTY